MENLDNATENTFLDNFIFNLQTLSAEDAIKEIGTANLSDAEIVICIKTITFSDTFKFNRKF